MFDAGKTGMIGLPYGEKNYDDMLGRFHTIPACQGQTDRRKDRRTDRWTDRIAISILLVSVLTRDKNNTGRPPAGKYSLPSLIFKEQRH